MSLPLLNTAPGYDEELRNSVFFERGLHATSICGVAAADLARHGLTGPPTVLEGRFGFLQAFCGDRAHPDAVVRGLGTDWELPRVVFKPYPCNHFTSGYHAAFSAPTRSARRARRRPRRVPRGLHRRRRP
jgi:2-methylcitrate dehydratase PrpD